jgi:hypothetical protein
VVTYGAFPIFDITEGMTGGIALLVMNRGVLLGIDGLIVRYLMGALGIREVFAADRTSPVLDIAVLRTCVRDRFGVRAGRVSRSGDIIDIFGTCTIPPLMGFRYVVLCTPILRTRGLFGYVGKDLFCFVNVNVLRIPLACKMYGAR